MTLSNLLEDNEAKSSANARWMMNRKEYQTIIQVINCYSNKETIAYYGARCLYFLTLQNNENKKDDLIIVMQVGALKAISLMLTNLSKMKPQTVLLTLSFLKALIANLGNNNEDDDSTIEKIFYSCLLLAKEKKLELTARKEALSIIEKIIEYIGNKKKLLNIKIFDDIIGLFEENVLNKYLAKLTINLFTIANEHNNTIDLLSVDPKILFYIAKALEKVDHEDRETIYHALICQLIKDTDIDQVLKEFCKGDIAKVNVLNILFLRDDLLHHSVKQGVITHLLSLFSEESEKITAEDLFTAKAITLVIKRIAYTPKYTLELVNNNILEVLLKISQIEDSVVLEDICECLQKFVINQEIAHKIGSSSIASSLVDKITSLGLQDNVLKSWIILISMLLREDSHLIQVLQEKIMKTINYIMSRLLKDKTVNQINLKLILSLSESALVSIRQSLIVKYLQNIISEHIEWKEERYLSLKILQRLCLSDTVPN